MQYWDYFKFGPMDGKREKRLVRRYPTLRLCSHVETGMENMAIYHAEKNQSPENVVYVYVRTASLDEGRSELDKTEWSG